MTVFLNLKVRWLLWRARVFDKLNRLDAIERVPMGVPLEAVVALYGPPLDQQASHDNPEATSYDFFVSPFHEVSVTIWNGVVQELAYSSSHPEPQKDLEWMLETYGEGIGWNVMTEGYSYRRNDGKCLLWCSAMPIIGVGTAVYNQIKAEVRRQRCKGRTLDKTVA